MIDYSFGLSEIILILFLVSSATYIKTKSANVATREDIGGITTVVEEIRLDYRQELEELRSELRMASEAIIRRRDVYERLARAMLIFTKGQELYIEDRNQKEIEFTEMYNTAWLWAPDEVIRAVNEFVRMNQVEPAAGGQRQRELKHGFFRVLFEMRQDAGFKDTDLEFDDLLFFSFHAGSHGG